MVPAPAPAQQPGASLGEARDVGIRPGASEARQRDRTRVMGLMAQIRRHGWAGHTDWRLPSCEELASLLKPD